MTRLTALGFLVAALFLDATPASRAADSPDGGPLKVVVHVNVAESGVQGAGLKNVANILKEAPDTQVEVVCHGAGIGLV
jgi:hypothetical protein